MQVCRVDRGLTLSVSLVKLTDDFIRVAAPIRHGRGDQDLDVVAAQQRKEFSIFDSSLEHELHRRLIQTIADAFVTTGSNRRRR
jgi:hypothetical protein